MPFIVIRHQLKQKAGEPLKAKYYRAFVSVKWLQRHDNGALYSCGLNVGETVSEYEMETMLNRKVAIEITHDEWNHSSCQSSCVRRGDDACRW